MISKNDSSTLSNIPKSMELQVVQPRVIDEELSLNGWTHVLCNEEMPIFSYTALRIHDILNDERKGATELAAVILQDPNLTVKLLKISNTPHYNPTRQKMVTVSRAIVMLGCDIIRELTLVCSFFESIISPTNKRQANEEIARAIHAAVQAKSFAIAVRDSSPEEIFIAALLKHIGSISFWCFCGEQGERIQRLLKMGNSHEQAEKDVLGFTLSDLGVNLSKSWKLGSLLEESIKSGALSKNPRVALVQLGYEISEALKDECDTKKYDACVKKIELLTNLSKKVINEKLKRNTDIAADIACQFGAPEAAKLIQKHLDQMVSLDSIEPEVDRKQLQLQISQDITSIISDQFDINLLLETVLEGIHRGIGMDRTMFTLLVGERTSLREKQSLGWRKESYEQRVVFYVSDDPPNLFHHALSETHGFWAKPTVNSKLYSLKDINVVGKNECFMMPIISNNTAIGLIYADRSINNEPLTNDDFNAFKYFAQQVNIGLTIYRIQRSAASK